MTDQPWTFGQARETCRAASAAQATVEGELREAYCAYAEAEETYRKSLAVEIVNVHAEGIAWSTAPDIARGADLVAGLRRKRDIAQGVKDAMEHAAWRRNADRKDAQRFSDWSERREMAEFHGRDPAQEQADFDRVIGGR